MGRAPTQRVEQAARALLNPGERVMSTGTCWAVQMRPSVPLLLLARRRYVVALTDRRMLVFARGRGKPQPSDLVIGKRYETFTLERVRRRRPLLQLVLRATSGSRLVLEFRRSERALAGELVARLTPPPAPATTEASSAAPKAGAARRGGSADPASRRPVPDRPAPTSKRQAVTDEDPAFWGSQQ